MKRFGNDFNEKSDCYEMSIKYFYTKTVILHLRDVVVTVFVLHKHILSVLKTYSLQF